jgi:uncharacterized protein (DUF4415 family)
VAPLTHQPGDKIRVKACSASCPGVRGVVVEVKAGRLLMRSVSDDKLFTVNVEEITNFSLAARKAWKKMPERQVGRPKGSTVCDRVSVTIRVDRDLWESFRVAEADGIVKDRTVTLNGWLREGLEQIAAGKRAS